MFKQLVVIILVSLSFMVSTSSFAALISVNPNQSEISIEDQVSVELVISGLGKSSALSISTFDFTLSYDSNMLSFVTGSFGNELNLFGLGSVQTIDDSVLGSINVFELSFDLSDDLDSLQSDSFLLAGLTFKGVKAGTSSLSLLVNSLGDSLGDPINANILNSSVDINMPISSIPVPPAIWLFSSSLLLALGIKTIKSV